MSKPRASIAAGEQRLLSSPDRGAAGEDERQAMDTRTPEQRRRIMQAVGSKHTGPELVVRRLLHSHGLQIPPGPQGPARKAGHRLHFAAQGDLRARLLLARPRLPEGAPAEIPPRPGRPAGPEGGAGLSRLTARSIRPEFDIGKSVLQWRQRGGSRGRLSAFLLREARAGAGKKPRRERTGEVRPLSRARNQAREPRRRRTRAGGRRRARRIRAQKGARRSGKPGGGADGREWSAMEKRYAGMERRNAGIGMANMTSHDKT